MQRVRIVAEAVAVAVRMVERVALVVEIFFVRCRGVDIGLDRAGHVADAVIDVRRHMDEVTGIRRQLGERSGARLGAAGFLESSIRWMYQWIRPLCLG